MAEDNDKTIIQDLAKELGEDAAVVKKAYLAYKSEGKAGLIKALPEVVAEIKDDIDVAKKFVPVAKAGYRTTEFWLIVALLAINALLPVFTNKVVPFDVNATLGTVLTVYTTVRGFLKSKTP